MLLGITLEQELRYPEAEKALLKSLEIQPTELALTNLGALYYQQERYGEAVGYFEKSLLTGPASALRVSNLGEAYRHIGRDQEANQAYHKAQSLAESEVRLNPRDASARALLAYLCARLDDSKRADFEITQAVEMEAGDSRVLRWAALTYETLGERAKTLEIARRASMPVLNELNHQPDVAGLQKDLGFQEILKDKSAQN
jgi:Flp pilus assembly protein TadD